VHRDYRLYTVCAGTASLSSNWHTTILRSHVARGTAFLTLCFTRLLSSNSGNHDELSKEIPTVTAKQLDGGSACQNTDQNTCDHMGPHTVPAPPSVCVHSALYQCHFDRCALCVCATGATWAFR